MAKRSHSDIEIADKAGGQHDVSSPPKRRKRHKDLDLSDELASVLEKCEDLIESITALGSSRSRVADEVTRKLQLDGVKKRTRGALELLSTKLLPESAIPETSAPTGRESSENAGAKVEDAEQGAQGAQLQIPSLASLGKWSSSDSIEMPPLVKVLDPALETTALCHVGDFGSQSNLSYERLEWLGDSYIHIVSSLLLYQTFPNHDPGGLTMLRELLIRNTTLAQFTEKYGLDKRAQLPLEFANEGRPGGTKATYGKLRKVIGDILEAYTAAAVLSDPLNGVSRVSAWLKALWRPIIGDHLRREEAQARKHETEQRLPGSADSVGPDAKTRLRGAIGARGVNIRYEDMPSKRSRDKDNPKLFVFTIGVYLDGWGEHNKLLGQGTALSKSKAGQLAAEMALDNKKQIAIYKRKKEALQAAIASQTAKDPPSADAPGSGKGEDVHG